MANFHHQTLTTLLQAAGLPVPADLPDVSVTGVVSDSRQVQPRNIFVALAGGTADGHRFIPNALERGAAGVVGVESLGETGFPYVRVENSRRALAHLAAAFHHFPARRLTVIGVTGTDGKTTTANLVYRILLAAGLRAGIISTVNATIGDEVLDTGFHVTTPEAPDVQQYLSRMLAAGLTHVVLEATSHGLEQERVTACEFDVGVVTNITHEHLDYHGSYEAYRAAKARLFLSLADTVEKPQGNPRLAVLNRDDISYPYLSKIAPSRQISYGLEDPGAGCWAGEIRSAAAEMQFTAHWGGQALPVATRLVGAYNVSNCLAAMSAALEGLRLPAEAVRAGIAALEGVPGRMERIDLGQDFSAVVDFAHTPNALRRVLETVRPMTQGKLWAVFGSAGLRDREKRRMMAEVSHELADVSIFTAEDPRTESLPAILAEMARGAAARGGVEGQTFHCIGDRREAIRFAVDHAAPGDMVLACGKGHEQSMCFGETEYPWDDRTALRAALAERLGVPGPEMPFLPEA